MSIYQSTPGGFTTEELAKSEAPAIYASMAVTFVIATLAVILRYVARVRSKAHISWDDYTILLALVCFTIDSYPSLINMGTRFSFMVSTF